MAHGPHAGNVAVDWKNGGGSYDCEIVHDDSRSGWVGKVWIDPLGSGSAVVGAVSKISTGDDTGRSDYTGTAVVAAEYDCDSADGLSAEGFN